MTSTANDNTVSEGRNASQSEITAFLLSAAERSPIVPIPGAIHDSDRFPVFDLTTAELVRGIRASESAYIHLVGLALLRRRLEEVKEAFQWN